MIAKLKRIIVSVSVLGLLGAPVMLPAMVSAQQFAQDNDTASGVCSGANLNADNIGNPDAPCEGTGFNDGSENTVTDFIRLIINVLSLVVGVIAVVMIIIGGVKYITSGGDSGNISGAKNTILYAVIGLIVVAAAQFIVRFVLGRVGSITT